MIITSSPNYHLYSKALLNHEKNLTIPIRIPNIITSNEKSHFRLEILLKSQPWVDTRPIKVMKN